MPANVQSVERSGGYSQGTAIGATIVPHVVGTCARDNVAVLRKRMLNMVTSSLHSVNVQVVSLQ